MTGEPDDIQKRESWRLLSGQLRTLVSDFEASGSHSHAAMAEVLARKLRTVEPGSIMLLKTRPIESWTNKAQVLAEEAIGFAIDWWPLPKPCRSPDGFTRVTWSCVSNPIIVIDGSDQRTAMRCTTINGCTQPYSE